MDYPKVFEPEIQRLAESLGINKVVCTRAGQERRYGDTYHTYTIYTGNEDSDAILAFAKEHVCKNNQTYEEFRNAKTMDDHFRGYHTFRRIPEGYKYEVVDPYCD